MNRLKPLDMNDDVWLIMPSANPEQAQVTLPQWKERGYRICLMLDDCGPSFNKYRRSHYGDCNHFIFADAFGGYAGYPWAIRRILEQMPQIDICVMAGDDMRPDPNLTAHQIAEEFVCHFPNGEGIMQPTGDPFMTDENGVPAAARICGSPWMTREFAMRLYRGTGPFHPGYKHLWADEDLQNVAIRNGWLWQRPDLMQYHDHYTRRGERRTPGMAIAATCHKHDKALFESRKAAGFPDSELSEARNAKA